MSYQALYRKYRPTNFDEVVGQKQIIQTLKNAIQQDRIGHAYLFCGPRGTGKTTIAKIFAKMLNCSSEDHKPCQTCDNCKMANNGSHPDIIEIDAASNNGVDEVRDLIDKVKYAPMQGKYKIYIIDEVHMMSKGAFNALLKTIEEPPAHVIFIFATTEPNKLLPTIISRCQRYDFGKVSIKDMVYRLKTVCELENIKVDDDALELIAELADGGMRDALSILDQCSAFSINKIVIDDIRQIYGIVTSEDIGILFKNLYTGNVDDTITLIKNYSEKGTDIKRLTGDFIHLLKESVILNYSENSSLVSDNNKKVIRTYFQIAPVKYRLDCIDELTDTYAKYVYASNVLDYLEACVLKLINKSYDSKKITEKSEISIQNDDSSEDISDFSYEVTSQKTIKSDKSVNLSHKSAKNDDVVISDVSRETLKQSEKDDHKFIYDDEFILKLLVGANKLARQNDESKYKYLNQYMTDLKYAKYAASLRNTKIAASGINYLIVISDNEIYAKNINEMQETYGYEIFTDILLGTMKQIFAIDKVQYDRVINDFKIKMKNNTLPQPIEIQLKSIDEQVNIEIDPEDHMKSLFPNIVIVDD